MKNYIIILLLFLSVGLSQNRVNVNNLKKYGDKYFSVNDDRPFDGIVFDLSEETGNKILEFRMVNGLKNGLHQEWSSDGILIIKGKSLNNTQVGDWTEWYENGQKKVELTYIRGSRFVSRPNYSKKYHQQFKKTLPTNEKDSTSNLKRNRQQLKNTPPAMHKKHHQQVKKTPPAIEKDTTNN